MSNTPEHQLLKTILNLTDSKSRSAQADLDFDNEQVKKNFEDAIIEIPEEAFTDDKTRYLFKTSKEHYNAYERIIDRNSFKTILDNDAKLTVENQALYLKIWDDVISAQSEAKDYAHLKDVVIEAHNKEKLSKGYCKCYDLVAKGQIDEANELGQRLINEARSKSSKTISFVSSAALKTMDIPPVKFIVEDLIPEGLTMLAAQKKAGKSAFVMQMGTCIALGLPFLGKQTRQGKVVYYSMEQSNNINKERLLKQGLGFSDNFLMVDDSKKKDVLKLNKEGIEQLRSVIEKNNLSCVIIDTWQKLAPVTYNKKDAYQNAVADISPLQELAIEKHCAIVVLTHTRKVSRPSEDAFDDVMGSTGLTGVADCILMLCRQRTKTDAVLHMISRVAKEGKWCVKFDDNTLTWSYEAEYADIRKGELAKNIQAVFKQENRELSIKELFGFLQVDYGYSSDKYNNVMVTVSRLAKNGDLDKTGRGKYSLNSFSELSGIFNSDVEEPVSKKTGIGYEHF